jgi:NADPH:quinone reductase-like Zn-dependent oxidoreductase
MNNIALRYHRFGEPESVLMRETIALAPLSAGALRVEMCFAPVNASDLIPVTGAYRHRTPLPAVAGYEGVGTVIDGPAPLLGKRVLPLRGQGTWQRWVDCPAELAIQVPDEVDSALAARAYINPLAAQMLLKRYPVRGKCVLLTAAGSDCAILLGQWALREGAKVVYGIHRSPVHADRLAAMGITPVSQHDLPAITAMSACAEIVFDATGGELAEAILRAMPESGLFVCYGLLSGKPFTQLPQVRWFHMRNELASLSVEAWQDAFRALWPRLQASQCSESRLFPFEAWRDALAWYREPGRVSKPLIVY